MSDSYTFSSSFSETHAKRIASKVATDLKRMQRYYGYPSDSHIADYEAELILLLKMGYIDSITYGFQRNGEWIVPTLRYSARELAGFYANDEDPGRVPANADVSGAVFNSYLVTNTKYDQQTAAELREFISQVPINRGTSAEPGMRGYMSNDKTYSAGGVTLSRSTLKYY